MHSAFIQLPTLVYGFLNGVLADEGVGKRTALKAAEASVT
jgi:hypothetical protein